MTIEDRIRRVLAEAASEEPPLRGAPLEVATRPRRARPLLAGVVAVVLVLAAVVALAAVRGQRQPAPLGPSPTTINSTRGWRTYTDPTGYLRFRYPPDWTLHRQSRGDDAVVLVPPEDAGRPVDQAGSHLRILLGEVYWVGETWQGTTARGRLPGGQAYLLDVKAPTAGRGDGGFASWSIDWGRWCNRRGRTYCGPHSVLAGFSASSSSAWDRHRAVADAIVRTATRLRPTGPSVGDRSRPPCRPDQWKLVWPEEWAMGDDGQRFVHQGGVRFRKGPPCHLRLTLRLAVQDKTGRTLPVGGNPATTTVEGDLPEDGFQWSAGSWVIGGAFMWRFAWQEWCNRGLPRATLKVTAPGAAALTVPGPRPSQFRPGPAPGIFGCEDRGRPSTVAGWPP
jgi:hypothetical protein